MLDLTQNIGNPLVIAILAGGKSRRMGQDKALLPIDGEPLLSRTVRLCRATGHPVWVVGRAAELKAGAPELTDVTFFPDEIDGVGPLGGLVTALRRSAGDVLALACDLPRLSEDAIRWLLTQRRTIIQSGIQSGAQPSGVLGVVTRNRGRTEPLFSIYDARCLPLCEEHLKSCDHALRALIAAGSFTQVDVPDWLSPCLENVNTPADLARLSP